MRQRRTPRPVSPGPLLVCHVVPVLSLTRRDAHPIEQLMAAAMHLEPAQPAGYELGRPQVNYEGAICLSAADQQHQHFAYGQLFRDGRIELVGTPSVAEVGQDGARALYPAQHEYSLVRCSFPSATQAMTALGIPAPAYVFVSLLGVRNLRVAVTRPQTRLTGYPALPAHLLEISSAPVYVEDFGADPATVLAPLLDVLWNAVGIEHTQTNVAEDGA